MTAKTFRHDLPRHMTDHAGVVSTSGGWYTHDHPHAHIPDKPGAQHQPEFSHRHEHRWQGGEDHHHAVEKPDGSG